MSISPKCSWVHEGNPGVSYQQSLLCYQHQLTADGVGGWGRLCPNNNSRHSWQFWKCRAFSLLDREQSLGRNVLHSCFYQLRQLRSVRQSLTSDARRTLASTAIHCQPGWLLQCCPLWSICTSHPLVPDGAERCCLPGCWCEQAWPHSPVLHMWCPGAPADSVQDCGYCIRLHRDTSPAYFKDVCSTVVDTSNRANLRSAHRSDMFVPRKACMLLLQQCGTLFLFIWGVPKTWPQDRKTADKTAKIISDGRASCTPTPFIFPMYACRSSWLTYVRILSYKNGVTIP